MKLLCVTWLAWILSGGTAFAQNTSQADWHVYGVGGLTCGTWKMARENKTEVQVELVKQWVAGWVVSYNYYLTERSGQGRVSTPDFDTTTAYLDKFCSEKPLSIIAFAAAQLVQDLGGATAFHNRARSK